MNQSFFKSLFLSLACLMASPWVLAQQATTAAESQETHPALQDELEDLIKSGVDSKVDPCGKIDKTPESERIDLWARSNGARRAALQEYIDKTVPPKAPENRRLPLTFALLCQGAGYKVLRELLICHFAIPSTKDLKTLQDPANAETK
jgi:hypothetical protein